jgi:2-methylcitrate dehydratase PrpD
MTFTQQLADRVLGVAHADLPAETRHWATVSILDTLGVAIAGSHEPGVRILDRVATGGASGGDCLLFGTERRVSPLDAALINGMAAHVLDYDASNPYFAGHATMHLLAGAFAVGEIVDASGADFLTAYVAGFEAQSRIARGLQPAHSNKGWFPSSTLGVFGVAAAAGHLLHLSRDQLAHAFGIAANLASGLLVNSGSMTKPLAAGHSARNGVLAALLAREGFTAPAAAFEHRYGFLKMFDVAGRFDPENALADWGRPFDVAVTAVGLKQHPCCGTAHTAIDVLAALVAEHGIVPADVAAIDAVFMSDHLAHVDRPAPVDVLDAKFSAYYCLARTVTDGRPRLGHFEGDAHRDPAVGALMSRIRLAVHPDLREGLERPKQGRAEIAVRLADGRVLHGARDKPIGREDGQPLRDDLLHGKFLDCVGRVLAPEAAKRLLAAVLAVDRAPRLKAISAAMRPDETQRPTIREKHEPCDAFALR